MPARLAVEAVNESAVVCNYVDTVQYVVDDASIIGGIPGDVPLIKYEARLTNVVVGGRIREVTPPVRVFFVMPEKLAGVSLKRRV